MIAENVSPLCHHPKPRLLYDRTERKVAMSQHRHLTCHNQTVLEFDHDHK